MSDTLRCEPPSELWDRDATWDADRDAELKRLLEKIEAALGAPL